MSYYDNPQWTAGAAQNNWDHQTPPTRSGASSVIPREDTTAFASQFEEVDRAIDNLFKNGRAITNMPGRRESMPMAGQGRDFPGYDPRLSGPSTRHHSVNDFGADRSYPASNVQSFYATQRQQPPRASEAEQVVQAKRRMAAQRERDLRNYHQEQQYNRSATAPSTASASANPNDRTMSPASSMSEDEQRRDLIARQRSALYRDGAAAAQTFPENGTPIDEHKRPASGGPSTATGPQSQGRAPETIPATQGEVERSASNPSPASNAPANSSFLFENTQQSSRTSASSPGGSPPRDQSVRKQSVAPIGTRPAGTTPGPSQAQNPAMTKQRSVTPLPSPLGYATNNGGTGGERVASTSSNATSTPEGGMAGGWGGKNGAVWGNKNSLTAQASVWG